MSVARKEDSKQRTAAEFRLKEVERERDFAIVQAENEAKSVQTIKERALAEYEGKMNELVVQLRQEEMKWEREKEELTKNMLADREKALDALQRRMTDALDQLTLRNRDLDEKLQRQTAIVKKLEADRESDTKAKATAYELLQSSSDAALSKKEEEISEMRTTLYSRDRELSSVRGQLEASKKTLEQRRTEIATQRVSQSQVSAFRPIATHFEMDVCVCDVMCLGADFNAGA